VRFVAGKNIERRSRGIVSLFEIESSFVHLQMIDLLIIFIPLLRMPGDQGEQMLPDVRM
jgi:hypothetical protein